MPELYPTQSNNVSEQFLTEKIAIGWPWRLLVSALIIFILSIFIYFGLKVGYESFLNASSETLDQNLSQLASVINEQDQQKFADFYSQLVNLKTVLASHTFSSNLFVFLETNTLPRVYFNRADFSADNYVLTLRGRAASMTDLVQQLAVFGKAPEAARIIINDTVLDQQGVAFGLTISFKPVIFQKPILQ